MNDVEETVFVLLLVAILTAFLTFKLSTMHTDSLIKECEAQLPRDQHCELYARPVEVKK